MTENTKSEEIREHVRSGYASIATSGSCCGTSGGCCGGADVEAVATALGYSEAELAELPEGANMGLSCGNPTALASLKPGEVVLDLGSGGGFDVFLAARKVGASGRAIGVDMTPEMLQKARRNAVDFAERTGLRNTDFRLGEIEHLPVADRSVDVIISNCVINLSPDKPQVWREMFRVLKPGGRVAVSDLALLKPLPETLQQSIEALVGCVAGAVLVSETENMAREAGFGEIECRAKPDYIDALSASNDPLYRGIVEKLPPGIRLGSYVTSLDIAARRPAENA